MPSLTRKGLVVAALGVTVGALTTLLPSSPARAQFTVFDPSNYTQNLLTAARTLQQVNNQIRSLQNEATMLLNQAKNLERIGDHATNIAENVYFLVHGEQIAQIRRKGDTTASATAST